MPTWHDLRSALLDGYQVVDADERIVTIRIDGTNGRHQDVWITDQAPEGHPEWIQVESLFAAVTPQALMTAIQYIGEEQCGALGLARITNYAVVRWTTRVEGITVPYFLAMVDTVAGHADHLEAAISGGADRF